MQPHVRLIRAAVGYALPFTAALLLLFILFGCSRGTKTVTVPAQEPTINVEVSDTLTLPDLPPVRPDRGERTFPGSTVVYTERPGGLLLRVRMFEVNRTPPRETISVQYVTGGNTVEDTWPLVAYGETFRLFPQTRETSRSGREIGRNSPPRSGGPAPPGRGTSPDTTGQASPEPPATTWDTAPEARITREPQERKFQAECPPCPEGWFGLKTELAAFGAFILVAGSMGAVHKFVRPFLPI